MQTASFEENLRPASDRTDDVLIRHDDEEEEQQGVEEEDEEFSFTSFGELSLVSADEAFADGQIKPFFPLFDRTSCSFDEEDLPKKPHVKKVFVQTKAGGDHQDDGLSSRTVVEATPSSSSSEACKKSNSTGFSKIWRFKDLLVSRSNSDGRDAFVFLNEPHAPPPPSKKPAEQGKANKVRRTTPYSAHEVYLRNKAKDGNKKRSSYLPYRPELMGFFTSVNGGFSKNVHPY